MTQREDKTAFRQLAQYERYLMRKMKEMFAKDRATELAVHMPNSLRDLTVDQAAAESLTDLEVFSVSSSQYIMTVSYLIKPQPCPLRRLESRAFADTCYQLQHTKIMMTTVPTFPSSFRLWSPKFAELWIQLEA